MDLLGLLFCTLASIIPAVFITLMIVYCFDSEPDDFGKVNTFIFVYPFTFILMIIILSSFSDYPKWNIQTRLINEEQTTFRIVKTPSIIGKKEIIAVFDNPDSAADYVKILKQKYKYMNSTWK